MMNGGQRYWVAQALIGLLCVAFVALAGRLVYIQSTMRPALVEWSERRQKTEIPLPDRRGKILDRRNRVLAGSHDCPTIYADPRQVEDHADAAVRLAPVLNLPVRDVRKLLDNPPSPGFVILKKYATMEEAEAVRALDIRGLGVRMEPARRYPGGSLAAHVIGFIGAEGTGLEGIELSCDKYLKGKEGKRVVYRDRRRRAVYQDEFVAPVDGLDVMLTIDAAIQEVVEREVARSVTTNKAESGLGIVMDCRTGDILALALVPTFDPAAPGKSPAEYRRNRALTDPVEPGSIFKPFIMAAAVQEGLTRPGEVLFCHNGLFVIGKRMLHDHHPYGNLTVEEVIAKSSNIGMAILGMRLGNAKMFDMLNSLGFGHATGIDLPGESDGLLMPLKRWNSYSTTSVPMGHEIAVTPIQVATAFSTIANGGRRVRPRVVRAVLDSRGGVIEDRTEVKDLGEALTPATAAVLRDMCVKTVNEGTATIARLDRWQVMGKTGTAQVPRKDRRGYEPDAYLGSFVCAAPASDPAVVVLVMIRKPDRRINYYGSKVAGPPAKAILEFTLPYLNVPPDIVTPQDARLVLHAAEAHD